MAVRIVRLGTPRTPGEGVRLGMVRRPPRGVPKKDYSKLDYYDVWLPELAPSEALLRWARSATLQGRNWSSFARRYRAEMARPPASRIILLLAALSRVLPRRSWQAFLVGQARDAAALASAAGPTRTAEPDDRHSTSSCSS